jgi:hypothetical protein
VPAHDFARNGETEPGTPDGRTFPAPEPFENAFAINVGNTWAVIRNRDGPVRADTDLDLVPAGRIQQRVLDNVPDCVLDGVGIPADPDRPSRA